MWQRGSMTVETSDGTAKVNYEIKVFDEGSIYGIDEGRISKLWLEDDDTGFCLASYDRGWDIMPCNEFAQKAVEELLDRYYWEK